MKKLRSKAAPQVERRGMSRDTRNPRRRFWPLGRLGLERLWSGDPVWLTGVWLGWAAASNMRGLRGEGRHSHWANWTLPPGPWEGREGLRRAGELTEVSLGTEGRGQNGRQAGEVSHMW